MSTNQRDGDGEGEDDGDGTDMNCDGHDEVGAWGSKRAGLCRAIHVQTSHGLGCRGDSARMLADGQRHARVL